MRIVVVDGHTLNPGDLSWDALAELGELEVYDRTAPDSMVERLRGAAVVLTNKAVLDRAVIERLDGLRYVGVLATGYNVVDVQAARERGITVTNVPAYAAPSVAQHAVALLLELTNRAGHHDATVHEGRWTGSPDFCYWDYPFIELRGLTMGVVGLGAIGREVARVGLAFGMRVLACDPAGGAVEGVEMVGLDELLAESDAVTLHCPLTEETEGLVNAARLARMKESALLVNTSRGPLVDEAALADALNEGRIAGAAVDVLSTEPPTPKNPLLSAKNCIVTPHMAWASAASRRRLMAAAVENVRAFLAGRPTNVVQ